MVARTRARDALDELRHNHAHPDDAAMEQLI
jgi:hypothetical protein